MAATTQAPPNVGGFSPPPQPEFSESAQETVTHPGLCSGASASSGLPLGASLASLGRRAPRTGSWASDVKEMSVRSSRRIDGHEANVSRKYIV